MEGALRGAAGPVDPDKFDATRVDDEDRIVVVRPAVVEHIGHVFGNLFQRIYHLTEEMRACEAATAEMLAASIRQLEGFLQLVMDYFSPLPLALQQVPATEVAQSLAREISDTVGCPVTIDGRHLHGQLLVDPGRLVRVFALLATQLRSNTAAQRRLALTTGVQPSNRSLVLGMCIPPDLLSDPSPATEMRWTVAEKVLESHGGALRQAAVPTGETSWEIVLPLQS